MSVFAYILEEQVYEKASNCCIFIKQLYCTKSNILTKPKMLAKSMEKAAM